MSITLNNSDFQCLQDQLVDLKTKNYELSEKNRRSQADFEAAKAKICTLQLKLEEQERDFQVIQTTLHREIESLTKELEDSKDEDFKTKYLELSQKAQELQQSYENSVDLVQQMDIQNKDLNEKIRKVEEENVKLLESVNSKLEQMNVIEKEYQDKIKKATDEYKLMTEEERQKHDDDINAITAERDELKKANEKLTAEIQDFDSRLERQAEERRIQEKKGVQLVRELKRQLALERNRSETLQKRLENLLSEPPSAVPQNPDLESTSQPSPSSSTNGNSSSNGNGSRANQDSNSVGSWSFVPIKTKSSNQALNESLSLCSIDSEDRETVQQPCDNRSEASSQQHITPADKSTVQNLSASSASSPIKDSSSSSSCINEKSKQSFSSHSYSSNHTGTNGMLIAEQAALVDRLTRLQHDKWMLEEKLSYMEQANSSLSEDLANKSNIIRRYFLDQALKANCANNSILKTNVMNSNQANSIASRRTSFPNNENYLIPDKSNLKKVVDFLKERSLANSAESESVTREATKKMQLMLEETLIKCIKLQENLDFVTSELNKFKS